MKLSINSKRASIVLYATICISLFGACAGESNVPNIQSKWDKSNKVYIARMGSCEIRVTSFDAKSVNANVLQTNSTCPINWDAYMQMIPEILGVIKMDTRLPSDGSIALGVVGGKEFSSEIANNIVKCRVNEKGSEDHGNDSEFLCAFEYLEMFSNLKSGLNEKLSAVVTGVKVEHVMSLSVKELKERGVLEVEWNKVNDQDNVPYSAQVWIKYSLKHD